MTTPSIVRAPFLSFLNTPARKRSLILGTSIASLLVLGTLTPHSQAQSEGVFSTSGSLGFGDNDALVGLSSTKTYVDAVNLGAATIDPLDVNGVMFEGVPGLNPSGSGWSLDGANFLFPSGGTNPGGQLGALTNDFVYNGNPAVFTLSDLTAGQTYVVTLYNRAWEAAGARVQTVTATGASTGTTVFDEDIGATGQGELNLLRYTFQATGSTQTLTFRPVIAGNTMHFYGFTTEQTFNNTWTSGTNWSTASWSVAQPNGAGSNAFFTAQASPQSITLDQARTVGHLQFDGAQPRNIAGSSLLTLQADVGGVSVLSALTGSHVIATPIELASDVVKLGGGSITLNGVVSGVEGLTINGGTLALGAANTYQGGTIVGSGGALRLNVADALGATGSPLTVSTGGTVDLNGNSQRVGILSGSGGAIANNATGTTAVLTIGVNSPGAANFAGVLAQGSGTLALTKTGTDTLTLSGANTYSGLTTINEGRLQLDGAAAAAVNTSGILVSAPGTFGFTAGTGTTLTMKPGSTVTLAGGTVGIDFGGANNSDKIVADTFALSANSTFAFKPVAPISFGSPYTLATYNTLANAGNFTIAGFTAGRLAVQPVIGANAITVTPVLDSGTWNNPAGGAWSTGPWTGYTPNAVGDAALFGPALTSNGVVTVDLPQTVGYLTFNNAVASYDIGTQGSSNLTVQNSGFPAIATVQAGSHTISENIVLASDIVVATNAGTALAVKGVLSGPGGLSKQGPGNMVLTGASTYTGGTTIEGGILQLGNGTTNGSITGNVANNATLAFNNSAAQTVAGAISGSGNVTKTGVGSLVLTNANTFTGGLTISAGSVDIGGDTPNGSVVGTITNNALLRFSRTGGITISAVVNGTGTTVVAGGVSQTLAATASINTPNVNVGDASQGYIYFGAPNQLNGTTGVLLNIAPHASNSRINLNGFNQTVAGLTGTGIVQNHEAAGGTPAATLTINVPGTSSHTWTGLIRTQAGGPLDLTKTGTGEQVMNFSITNPTYEGVTRVEQGRLVFGSTFANPVWSTAGIVVSAGAELGLTGSGAGIISWNTNNRVISGAGGLARVGADGNIVTIANGANSYTGATRLSGTGSLAVSTLANIGSNSSIGAGNSTSSATNAASLVFDGGVLRYTGGTANSNRLFTLTERGGTINASGTGALNLTNPGVLGTTGTGARTLVLTGASPANNTLAGALPDGAGGATSLSKTGSGTWVLSGANTYTGATNITGGRLQLEGGAATNSATSNVAVNAGGTLGFTSGTGSILTLANTLSLNGGIAALDLGSAAASDKIAVNTLALTANSTFGFNPISALDYGSTYTLATYATLSNAGGFTINGLTAGRLTLTPVLGPTAITMTPNLDSGVWDGTGGGTWSAGPWTGYTPNALGDAALFGAKLAANGIVTVDSPKTAGYLTFANTAASYTVGTAGSANLTLANVGTTPAHIAVQSGNHTIAEDINLTSDALVVTNASTSLTVSGALKGSGRSVLKTGAGTLTLSGANEFGTTGAGGLTVNAGTVVAGTATGLPLGLVTRINGGVLDLNGNDATLSSLSGTAGSVTDKSGTPGTTTLQITQIANTTFGGTFLDGAVRSLAVRKSGSGALTLAGSNAFTGGLTITEGSVIAANPTGASLPGDVTMGDGTAELFLIMGAPNQFGPGSVIQFTNGALNNKLELRGFDQTVAGLTSSQSELLSIIQNQEAADAVGSATLTINTSEDHDFKGLIRSLGSTAGNALNIVKTGPATQIIRNIGAQGSNFGTATINQGKLVFNLEPLGGGAGHDTLGGGVSVVVNSGGTLGLDGNWNMSRPVSGAGNVIKEGPGAVVVSGNFTHTGPTTIAAGTLSLVGSISGSTVIDVQADATFDVFSTPGGFTLQAAQTLSGKGTVAGDLAVNGTVSPGPGIATLTTESLTFNGGSTFALEINTATRAADRVLSSGDFSLATGVLPTLSVTDVGGNVALALGTQLTLLTYTGDWNGGLFRVAGAPIADGGVFTLGANQFQLDYDAGGNSLALIAVPEPGAAMLLLTGFTSLVGFRRRRK